MRAVLVMGGNIPTYVGKTGVRSTEKRLPKKHPNLRGENAALERDLVAVVETSPPTWGKPSVNVEQVLIGGNIPTYVGKTKSRFAVAMIFWKHPHLRGENRRARRASARASETSPPTWGKRKNCRRSHEVHGNIPTYVGKTSAFWSCRS